MESVTLFIQNRECQMHRWEKDDDVMSKFYYYTCQRTQQLHMDIYRLLRAQNA